MAVTDISRSVIQSASGEAQNVFAGVKARFARHRLYRQTLAEMQALSNRELADLGMHRSEIPRIARQAVFDR